MEIEKPTSDNIRAMHWRGTPGFMYVRVEKWREANIMRITYFNPQVKYNMAIICAQEQFKESCEEIAKKVGREFSHIA